MDQSNLNSQATAELRALVMSYKDFSWIWEGWVPYVCLSVCPEATHTTFTQQNKTSMRNYFVFISSLQNLKFNITVLDFQAFVCRTAIGFLRVALTKAVQ